MSSVRFCILVAVTVKNIVLWGLTPCNVSCQCFYMLCLLFDPEGGSSMF